jgi:Uma2 family endonuclease
LYSLALRAFFCKRYTEDKRSALKTLRGSACETVWDNNMSAIQTSETQAPDISLEDVKCPPSDLYSDEPELESYLHLQQLTLFLTSLEWYWKERNDFFAAGNLTIYYDEQQLKFRDFLGPDFFVVLGTDRKPRRSWTIWAEGGKYPNFIVEVLSSKTETVDRNQKKILYQGIFRAPDYFWFHPDTLEFQGFHLIDGVYQPLEHNEKGWLWSQQLGLFLGIEPRQHFGIEQRLIRFFTPDGILVPIPQESLEQAQHQLERERQRAQQLMQKLREMGVEIE